ncbi:DUF1835 domain-containing protein [Mucilaginibacter phyllosphaerae]|uniref:DUF1835 domain-containing protein n=1 Tax=Mucilaginibacter phyllosphaerae TaxID=1812349 RepID=A0A4Y8AF38_9SPHI|nr:hypothetical protein [Mucilaginibacter phyllosphaerae]MBB3970262.1 hypothetical protein [Mucilaginibacter phyllosphaerae]TEW66641.1 hypothetical protein E2R65_09460 [Mucilaginibacter phyllosphaerae]GGH10899.1 hypothetical protein GCM10007352_16880 [Mucilaginibacter phyllosphaerae]
MSTILHVLNGDATLNGFEQTSLDGDILVWREVLSEGPVSVNIEGGEFWKNRTSWIINTFDETSEGYQTKVIEPLAKLNEPYEEINLWFEFDLHCQVNLLGIMMLLSQQTNLSGPAVYLICPAEYPGVEDFRGMGELDGGQLEDLYDNTRVQLSDYDFELATEAWSLYINGDASRLQGWLNSVQFWANMQCLKPALQAHLKRLQTDQQGLNYIQQTLLDIYNRGIKTRPEIYRAFWQANKIYGMGDSELNIYLNELQARKLINI